MKHSVLYFPLSSFGCAALRTFFFCLRSCLCFGHTCGTVSCRPTHTHTHTRDIKWMKMINQKSKAKVPCTDFKYGELLLLLSTCSWDMVEDGCGEDLWGVGGLAECVCFKTRLVSFFYTFCTFSHIERYSREDIERCVSDRGLSTDANAVCVTSSCSAWWGTSGLNCPELPETSRERMTVMIKL